MLLLIVALAAVTPATEVSRIQTHLATVEAELRAAEPPALTPAQRALRTELLDELAAYRMGGRFPRNLSLEAPTPFFIDDRGVRCAMAHLIETHGGADLVARVAATRNNAYVRELAGDPALRAWLARHGLTAAEAARIQPSYPRMAGERCAGALYRCSEGTCEPSLDEPTLSFCSPACEPGGASCPVGYDGVAMECQLRGDRHLCVYPVPSPGTLGWPCDPMEGPGVCIYTCIPAGDDGRGECTAACSGSQACPEGYECEPLAGNVDHLRSCRPRAQGGCSASTAPASSSLVLWLLVLGAAVGRGRRPRPGDARNRAA